MVNDSRGENMGSGKAMTAGGEWRAYWALPVAAMIGYSTIGLQSYGIGPFVTSLEQEFGWTRAQVMIGLSLSNLVGVFLNILIGMIVDRFGPRRVGLTGLFVKTGSFALLGTATGTLLNWSLLWMVLAVGVVLVQSTVWTSAVAARFDRSRGLAMAVALSGTPITAAVVPVLAAWLIGDYGWRIAFAGVAGCWLAATLPVVFIAFRDGRDEVPTGADGPAGRPATLPGLTLREGMRTAAFWRLLVAFGAFSFYNMSVSANLVPMLGESGATSAAAAAGIASIMGLVGIVARLSVGFLLDRMPGNLIGAATQILPVIGCAILMLDDPGFLLLALAVATFGIATGAEIDVALYLATRHFGLRAFAALFGAIITFGAINAAIGPYAAGWMHDVYGSYDPLLIAVMVAMTIGAVAMGTIGRRAGEFAGH
jgi:cyanate permease